MAEANRVVPPSHPSSEDNTYRILLVGKTGSGKSATGNTLLGAKKFKTKLSPASETYECQLERTENTSFCMEVMDCPGLFDTKTPNKVVKELIMKAVGGMHPGPNAILYAMKVGDRFTEEEYRTFERLKKALGPEVVHYMIIVFTHGDQLAMDDITIKEYVDDGTKKNDIFGMVLGQCGNRYVEFNNTPAGPKGQQVEILLTKINDMVRGYRHRTFTNEKFEIVAVDIEGEVRRRVRADNNEARGSSAADNSQLKTAEADTSRQDSDEPVDDPIPEEDTELADRLRFQLRQEIAQSSGLFSIFFFREYIVDAGCTSGCAMVGASLGSLVGPVGGIVGTAIGATAGSLFSKYVQRKRLRNHLKQLFDTWEEKRRVMTAGDSAQNTERAT